MSQLGIPGNLQASSGTNGIVNLSWVDTPPSCNPAFSVSSGSVDETVKSSSKTWTLNNSLGTVTWGITGIGASIDQNGVVTTTGAACGTLTITATDSCCGVYTQQVRVTDGGTWVEVSRSDCSGTIGGGCSGGSVYFCYEYIDGLRYQYRYQSIQSSYPPYFPACITCIGCTGSEGLTCGNWLTKPPCATQSDQNWLIIHKIKYEWSCP